MITSNDKAEKKISDIPNIEKLNHKDINLIIEDIKKALGN